MLDTAGAFVAAIWRNDSGIAVRRT
jgi:hypothetical protein